MFSLSLKVCAEHMSFKKLFFGNSPGYACFLHRCMFDEISENESVVSRFAHPQSAVNCNTKEAPF